MTALIGVDWGTTNLRVMRIAEGGAVLQERSDRRGAGGLAPDAFPAVLTEIADDWIGLAPLLVCGMAGARGRWREMAYRTCPTRLNDLAEGLERPEGALEAWIVPGVAVTDADGAPADVMRGEETQVLGLMGPGDNATVIAPGTHSKWIRVTDGAITGLRTFVTGELFQALRRAGVLVPSGGETSTDDGAFRRGVERALADPAPTAALFSVRVDVLAGRLDPKNAADYLSGLLIGCELAAQTSERKRLRSVLVGAQDLVRRYDIALGLAGFASVEKADGAAAAARGLWRIWKATGR